MHEKESTKETHETAKVIDKKIQYGENEYSCFACGEIIKFGTKICPNCNTAQEYSETVLK